MFYSINKSWTPFSEEENLLLPFKVKTATLEEKTLVDNGVTSYTLKYQVGNKKFEYNKTLSEEDNIVDIRANAHKQLDAFKEQMKARALEAKNKD
jgi:hypothetical protein